MIKTLIIDDEKHCADNLLWQIKQYCPEIEVAAVCQNAEMGLKQIKQEQPQLIFLDVEMPGMSGFEMLEALPEINFDIIFTTGFNQYAIRAIKFGALDYLIKPVDKDELRTSLDTFLKSTQRDSLKQLNALLTHVRNSKDLSFQKIAFPTLHGYELVPLSDIVACESNSNYTTVYFSNGKNLLVSRTLKQIEEILDMAPFYRIHHSFLVNLHFAIRYIKGEGGFLVLNEDLTVPVSRNRKEELLKIITHLSH
jgi:two-component system, LytTR family, response regulator